MLRKDGNKTNILRQNSDKVQENLTEINRQVHNHQNHA